ncbi:MAG: glycosyltransferase family 2 protein [Woeseiaceae bacterium]
MANRTEEEIVSRWKAHSPVKASVCCITYNHENFIHAAIDSFLAQETDFPFEIVVHDDASTDGTADILRDYAAKYPGLIRTIIQSENQYSKGGLISLRLVFPKAKGEYIAICEGDDYWTDSSKLQQQVAFLENNPDYVITYSDCQAFDESGFLDLDCGGARHDLEATELKKAASIATLTTCFRNVIGEIPQDLLSARYGDMVTWSLLGHHGKGKYLPGISPSAYRMHGDGLHSMRDTKAKATMHLVTVGALFAYYERIGDEKLARFFKIRMFMSMLNSMGFVYFYRMARTLYQLPKKVGRALRKKTDQR